MSVEVLKHCYLCKHVHITVFCIMMLCNKLSDSITIRHCSVPCCTEVNEEMLKVAIHMQKRSHTYVTDPRVHVRVRWIMETPKQPALKKKLKKINNKKQQKHESRELRCVKSDK